MGLLNTLQEDLLGGAAALPAAHTPARGAVAQRHGDGGDGGRAQVGLKQRWARSLVK